LDEIQRDGKTYTTLTALAARTGYDREYLRKLAKSAKVDAIQIGSAWLINAESLGDYQESRSNRKPHKRED